MRNVTIVVAPGHRVRHEQDDDGLHLALCSCGWHAGSVSPDLRSWNVEAHVANVEKGYDR